MDVITHMHIGKTFRLTTQKGNNFFGKGIRADSIRRQVRPSVKTRLSKRLLLIFLTINQNGW